MKRSFIAKKFMAFLLAFAMIFSSLPLTAFADDAPASSEPTTVSVDFTAQAEGAFLCAPQFGVEVSSDLAESYGYTDQVTGGVSALDVLVKAHEVVFGEAFTKDTKDDYLAVSSSGYVSKLFATETTSNGFTLNGGYPNDGTESQYGGYNGTTVTTQVVKNGDSLEFFIYQDTSYWSDELAWFCQNGTATDIITASASTDITLSMQGIGYMSCYRYVDAAAIHEAGSPVEDAQLAWVDEKGSLTDITGAVTGADGNVKITAPTTAGIHYLTAYMPAEEIENFASPLIMTLTKVEVLPDYSITVPADAKVYLGRKDYSGYNYKLFTELTAVCTKDNGDGTTTYYYDLAKDSTCTYRISGDDYVTYTGTFKKTAGGSLAVTKEQLQPAGKNKNTVDHDVKSNNGYNVADIYLNINAKGYLKLDKAGDTYQLVNLRNWEAVDTTTNNYFIEPDYHYTVINEDGTAGSDVVTVDENGLLTANKNGTAIVLVTYDAFTNASAVGGPFFGAIWPENTGVFVVSVGAEDSGIETGMTLNTDLNNPNQGKDCGDAIDAEHDVIYFVDEINGEKTGEQGEYTFAPKTAGCAVAVANPTVTDKMSFSGFEAVNANTDGSYTVPLTEGRNIVKITKDGKAEYQVITAKAVSITVNNGEAVQPGDKVTVKFDTVYHPVNKLAGLYNFSAYIVYADVDGYDGQMVGSKGSQYNFASNANAQTVTNLVQAGAGMGAWGSAGVKAGAELTVPEDYNSDTFTIANGAIFYAGWGDYAGNHRGISLESGKNPNLNAGSPYAYMGQLPDIEIPITVTDAELDSIALTTDGVKTQYYAGDTFDTTNLVVTAKYADGKTQTATNYSVSPQVLTEDTTEVTITYRGKTAVVSVTVTPLKVESIEVTAPPTKTQYNAGDVFDPTGMVVTATYNNGKQAVVTDYEFEPKRELTADDTAMTINYTGSDGAEGIAAVTTPITVKAASEGGNTNNITVSFTLLGDSKHGENGEVHTLKDGNLDTWIAKTNITVPKGSYVIDVVAKALGLAGIPYENPSGNYITTIRGLGEFSNGSLSGWMYTLNGKHPTLGVAEQVVKNGDKIVFHYTDDYTIEQGSENWSGGSATDKDQAAADKVIELIKAIGTVDANSGDKITAARTAYDKLTDAQKKLVTNYSTLTKAEADFAALNESTGGFTDVKADHWAKSAIDFVVKNNLFQGTSATTFEPETAMNRGMLVTVLWRLEGKPAPADTAKFADVKAGAYYAEAVAWASENGIVNGVDTANFAPEDKVSREQMAAIFARYAEFKGYDVTPSADLSKYTDSGKISAYAVDSIKWANSVGLITGRTADTLAPQGDSTRAEVATMIQRFVENIMK